MGILYLDPKNDIAFRKLFGQPSNKDVTINLLNSILNFQGKDVVTDIKHLDPHLLPRSIDLRESIVDLLCEDQRGQRYIVELQVLKAQDFDKRILYYASKTYADQILKGEKYSDLKKVYLVSILDHRLFDYTSEYKTEHGMTDLQNYIRTFRDFEFHIIELPKFTKTEEELQTPVEKWVHFFKTAARSDHIPQAVTEPEIKKAYELMAEFNWNDVERHLYERSNLAIQDAYNIEAQAKADGRAEGEIEATQKIVRGMLEQNIPLETIAKITGLSLDQIQSLKKAA